jgi:hypothetical protein
MLLTPSRRFREEDGGQGQHPTGNQLDGERDVPLLVTVRDVQVDSVVDPEPDDGSDLPPGFVDTDQSTSNSRWRDLRDVDGLHEMMRQLIQLPRPASYYIPRANFSRSR